MKAVWSGSISFGLVNIPVNLYPATQDRTLDFDFLRKKDNAPVGYKRVTKDSGEEVAYQDLVRGYEVQKGKYVVLNDEDFKKANVKKTQTIDIVDFVKEEEIDSKYFIKPYYIEPDKKARKAYVLLREALKESKKVAVALFVLKSKEHLAMIKYEHNILVLVELRFQTEIREARELDIPQKEEVTGREMSVAKRLIDHLTDKFDPQKYKDTYTAELLKMIKHKQKGRTVTVKEEDMPVATEVPDLMKRLEESLKHDRYKSRHAVN